MQTFMSSIKATIVTLFTLTILGCHGEAMHKAFHAKADQPAGTSDKSSAPQPTTYSIADDGSAWKRSPHMRAFYDTTVATFAQGTSIDVDVYESKSFAIFREFARANGVSEEAMIDHLKLIPRQVVGIVKEDPAVLKSYDAFWVAMVGPD